MGISHENRPPHPGWEVGATRRGSGAGTRDTPALGPMTSASRRVISLYDSERGAGGSEPASHDAFTATAPPSSDPSSLLPLSEPVFQIILAVAGGPRHGYAIMLEVEERTGGRVRLGPGTL